MPIGLTARQKSDLAAMLPNIEESVAALKRLIADTKDRSRALQKLSDAEEAQKRHANEVGIPFNAEAFSRRRAELDALPKTLTVEDGQLAAFTALQRSIGIVLEGPFERAGRAGKAAAKTGKAAAKKGAAKSGGGSGAKTPKGRKPAAKSAAPRTAAKSASGRAKSAQGVTPLRPKAGTAGRASTAALTIPRTNQKPLPLALGS